MKIDYGVEFPCSYGLRRRCEATIALQNFIESDNLTVRFSCGNMADVKRTYSTLRQYMIRKGINDDLETAVVSSECSVYVRKKGHEA